MPRRARPSLEKAGFGAHSFVPSPLRGRRSFSGISSRGRCLPDFPKRERIPHSSHAEHSLFHSRHPVSSSSSLCLPSSTHSGSPSNVVPRGVSPNRLLFRELKLPVDCSSCSPPPASSSSSSTSFFTSSPYFASFSRSHSTHRPRSFKSAFISSRPIASFPARVCHSTKENSSIPCPSQTLFSFPRSHSSSISSRIQHCRPLLRTSLFTSCCAQTPYLSATIEKTSISVASAPFSETSASVLSPTRPWIPSPLTVPLLSSCTVGGQRSFFSFSVSSLFSKTGTSKIVHEASPNSASENKPSGSPDAGESAAIVTNSSDTTDTSANLRRSSPAVHTPETAQGPPVHDSTVLVEEKERNLSQATKEDRDEASKVEESDQGKNLLEEYFLSPSGYDGPADGSYRTVLLERIKEAVRKQETHC